MWTELSEKIMKLFHFLREFDKISMIEGFFTISVKFLSNFINFIFKPPYKPLMPWVLQVIQMLTIFKLIFMFIFQYFAIAFFFQYSLNTFFLLDFSNFIYFCIFYCFLVLFGIIKRFKFYSNFYFKFGFNLGLNLFFFLI